MIKLLQLDGWVQVRMRGSHRQFKHPIKTNTVTVAGKLSKDMPTGTWKAILRQAQIQL